MEIVINVCYGGFSLSPEATKLLAAKKGKECYFFDTLTNNRCSKK